MAAGTTGNTGYSGTPLAKKLGIKAGGKLHLINAPYNYFALFDDLPSDQITQKPRMM